MNVPFPHWIALIGRAFGLVVLMAGIIIQPTIPPRKGALMVYDFDLGPVPASNVDQVRSLGFQGLVTTCKVVGDVPKLASYARYVSTLDNFRMLAYVDYDFNLADSPMVWRRALPILAKLDAPLWVIIQNAPTIADVDALLLQMAREAARYGVPVVIYPHWNTNISSAAEAAARIAQVGHSNIHNSLHTCHEIRSGNQDTLEAVVATHLQQTRLVTIAGADLNAYAGPPPHVWDDAIRPLDRGGFDLLPYLRALENAGYDGPVILQTWGLSNDPGHLARSIARYSVYRRTL